MFIELIDLLRCTRPHEDSWLVAAFQEMRERVVVEGLLSCPVCGARYPVTNGVAWFDVEPEPAAAVPVSRAEEAIRVAAYLNLVEPGLVLLGGAWGGAAEAAAELGNRVIALNSPGRGDDARVSRLRSDRIVPLARECLDGIALSPAEAELAASAANALKVGARILAPAAFEIPRGLLEIARDDQWWVAAREGGSASAPVQIARR